MDPYETLRVKRTASLREINLAYNKLMLSHHPDKFRDKHHSDELIAKNEKIAKELSDAVEMLRNEEERKLYDSVNNAETGWTKVIANRNSKSRVEEMAASLYSIKVDGQQNNKILKAVLERNMKKYPEEYILALQLSLEKMQEEMDTIERERVLDEAKQKAMAEARQKTQEEDKRIRKAEKKKLKKQKHKMNVKEMKMSLPATEMDEEPVCSLSDPVFAPLDSVSAPLDPIHSQPEQVYTQPEPVSLPIEPSNSHVLESEITEVVVQDHEEELPETTVNSAPHPHPEDGSEKEDKEIQSLKELEDSDREAADSNVVGEKDKGTPDEGTPDEGTQDEETHDEGTPDEGTQDKETQDEAQEGRSNVVIEGDEEMQVEEQEDSLNVLEEEVETIDDSVAATDPPGLDIAKAIPPVVTDPSGLDTENEILPVEMSDDLYRDEEEVRDVESRLKKAEEKAEADNFKIKEMEEDNIKLKEIISKQKVTIEHLQKTLMEIDRIAASNYELPSTSSATTGCANTSKKRIRVITSDSESDGSIQPLVTTGKTPKKVVKRRTKAMIEAGQGMVCNWKLLSGKTCEAVLANSHQLSKHRHQTKMHVNKRYSCPKCGRKYTRKDNATRHDCNEK